MKRIKKGTVVSNKPAQTLVVRINRKVSHPVYKKAFNKSKKFYVHCENNIDYKEGDIVSFQEHRPLSKLKRWIIVKEEK